MQVSQEFNIVNLNVACEIGSKYTKINRKNFGKYLIDKKQVSERKQYEKFIVNLKNKKGNAIRAPL